MNAPISNQSATGAPLSHLWRGDGGEEKVLLTHPGTQYSYQLAAQLERLDILYCFATGLAFGEDSRWLQWLPKAWRKKLQRRTVAGVPRKHLFTLPILEIRALWKIKRGGQPEQVLHLRNQAFQRRLPQRLIDNATVVIGFDTSSLELIGRCRQAGKPFVLDASIAHPLSQQHVFAGLRRRFPLWAGQLPEKDPLAIRLEQEEMQEADRIVAASGFTRSTYIEHGIPAARISVNPYGTDLAFFRSKWEQKQRYTPNQEGSTCFLFFSKISARKGFPWLCEVWEGFHTKYPNTRLVAAGYDAPPAGFTMPAGVDLRGFVHPADRETLFHGADVFVFPSYFEGFAQVIIEAMACGLPVITTTHTIGPEIITNGEEGFCIHPGDDNALLQAIEYFELHPEKIELMGKKARQRVAPLTWAAYGERWKKIIEDVVSHPKK